MIKIDKLKLENARLYDLCQIEPGQHLNVIFGDNGCGKTTVLEAIYIGLTGKSFKTNRLKEFIQNNKEYAKTQLNFNKEEHRDVLIKPRSKELLINGSKVRALSEFCKDLACVSLIPEDIALINGSSQYRRKYLDHILFYQDVSYAGLLQDYKKALSHKNSLLKAKLNLNTYLDQVAPWHQKMVQLNQVIRDKRKNLLNVIFEPIQNYYQSISEGKGLLESSYQQNEESFKQSIQEKSSLEHGLARSLYGCHKDNIQLNLNNRDLNSFASQGERASSLLALKFAELSYIKTFCSNIILLLDDIGGTLDQKRRKILLEGLKEEQYQTFITTADNAIQNMSKDLGADCFKRRKIKGYTSENSSKTFVWESEKNI